MILILSSALLALVVLSGCTGRNIIGRAEGWTPLAIDESTIYVASSDGHVVALDPNDLERDEDAAPIWEYEPPTQERGVGSVFNPPAIGDSFVFVGGSVNVDNDETGRLVALRKDRRSSSRLEEDEWEENLPGAIIGSPVVANGMVLVGSEDGNLHAFSEIDGARLWIFPTDGLREGKEKDKRIWSTPVVKDEIAYFGAMDDYLYAISISNDAGLSADDRTLWKFKTNGAIVTKPIIIDELLIFGSFDRKIYALDISEPNHNNKERLLWSYQGDNWYWAGVVTDGSTVYVASMDGKVNALPIDRREKDLPLWEIELNDSISSTPFLAGSDLIVATDQGKISFIDSFSGQAIKVAKDIDSEIRAPLTGTVIGDSAMVYVGDKDGVVRAIDLDGWRFRWEFATATKE